MDGHASKAYTTLMRMCRAVKTIVKSKPATCAAYALVLGIAFIYTFSNYVTQLFT